MFRPRPTDDELLAALSGPARARYERMDAPELIQLHERDYRRLEVACEQIARERAALKAIGAIARRKMAQAGEREVLAFGPRGETIRYRVQADGRGFRRERVDAVDRPGHVRPDAGAG